MPESNAMEGQHTAPFLEKNSPLNIKTRDDLLIFLSNFKKTEWKEAVSQIENINLFLVAPTEFKVNLLNILSGPTYKPSLDILYKSKSEEQKKVFDEAFEYCLLEAYLRNTNPLDEPDYLSAGNFFRELLENEFPLAFALYSQEIILSNDKKMHGNMINNRNDLIDWMLKLKKERWRKFFFSMNKRRLLSIFSNGEISEFVDLYQLTIFSTRNPMRDSALEFCFYELFLQNGKILSGEKFKNLLAEFVDKLQTDDPFTTAINEQKKILKQMPSICVSAIEDNLTTFHHQEVVSTIKRRKEFLAYLSDRPREWPVIARTIDEAQLISLLTDTEGSTFNDLLKVNVNYFYSIEALHLFNRAFEYFFYEVYLRITDVQFNDKDVSGIIARCLNRLDQYPIKMLAAKKIQERLISLTCFKEKIDLNTYYIEYRFFDEMIKLDKKLWFRFCKDLSDQDLINILSNSTASSFTDILNFEFLPHRNEVINCAKAFCLYELYKKNRLIEPEGNLLNFMFKATVANFKKISTAPEKIEAAIKMQQALIEKPSIYDVCLLLTDKQSELHTKGPVLLEQDMFGNPQNLCAITQLVFKLGKVTVQQLNNQFAIEVKTERRVGFTN